MTGEMFASERCQSHTHAATSLADRTLDREVAASL
jgi:hypothetical protein